MRNSNKFFKEILFSVFVKGLQLQKRAPFFPIRSASVTHTHIHFSIQAYAIKATAICTHARDVHIEKIINMLRDLYDICSDSAGCVIYTGEISLLR